MADRPVGWMELLILNESLLKEMKADVCRCLPDEACGLIGGRGEQGRMVLPVSNTLQGGTRFYMDPQGLVEAILKIESAGMEVVGIYHSHPRGPAVPSATDVQEHTWHEAVTLIWSPEENGWQVRAFLIGDHDWREIMLCVDQDATFLAGEGC